jgi:3-oxoacyl-[acyl-carrier protein] reductase
MELIGQIALVTGAGSGFGAAISERFAAEGAEIIAVDLEPTGAEQIADRIGRSGGRARAYTMDVASSLGWQRLASDIAERAGRLDIIVNNAGMTYRKRPMIDVGEDEFDRLSAVNMKSIFLSARYGVPLLRRSGAGSIINIASTGAFRPGSNLTWYHASKGWVVTATKAMAMELAPDRIRVNAISPMLGVTGLLEEFMGEPDTPDARARFSSMVPLGRLCEPDDVAKAAVFLASKQGDYLTGTSIPVDGGWLAGWFRRASE